MSNKAVFTNEQLEYIYDYLEFDFDNHGKISEQIETKIRLQIEKYRKIDLKK